MSVKNAVSDVMAAVNVMQRARDVSTKLSPLTSPMSEHELAQRATMIAKVIRARSKLQQLRNRAEALEGALDRFKARRAAMRA
jgi:BMFP domain-containing protein YqiC